MNTTCNSTLESMRILPGSEIIIVGSLNFHELARIIAAACTLIATLLNLHLVFMHAVNYTQPREQRYIIRILFMVPVYAISSFCQLQWYWHAIYFQVMSDCYEAFAIASFFALLCHYVAPDLHDQKAYFREMQPVKPWIMPVNWFAKCCAGERGPWRTPKSGLTWFNIIWIGIYHYCFIRVAMTITAVVTQYFERYCESSNSPVFGHIWTIVINALAVTIAMFCLVQFYVQLREPLVEHKLFIKIVAIKLVVFLSFWQASAISVGTSTLKLVHPNRVLAYPDLKVGIPALLLCVEMACFACLHLWAFPWKPYVAGATATYYPVPDPGKATPSRVNERCPPRGGPLGLLAVLDALNLWDFVKAFGRGMRWLFCGVQHRKDDISYKVQRGDALGLDDLPEGKEGAGPYDAMRPLPSDVPASFDSYGRPIADTDSGSPAHGSHHNLLHHHPHLQTTGGGGGGGRPLAEESVGLVRHAQPNPEAKASGASSSPALRPYLPPSRNDAAAFSSPSPSHNRAYRDLSPYDQRREQRPQGAAGPAGSPSAGRSDPARITEAQDAFGQALWGSAR